MRRQLDLADGTIRLEVGMTKNGHGRTVKMTQEVYTLLQACVTGKGLTITYSPGWMAHLCSTSVVRGKVCACDPILGSSSAGTATKS
jgi:hypothetical protein